MELSWLTYVVLVFLVFCILNGYRRGLIRTAVSMASLLLIIIIVSAINPYVSGFIQEKTPLYDTIEAKCKEAIQTKLGDEELGVSSQMSVIENLPLPESIKDKLTENNNSEVYQMLAVDTFSDYASKYAAKIITNDIAYLLSFLIAVLVIKIAAYALDIMARLPILHGINRLGGLLLGGVWGLLIVWVAFLVITLLCATSIGAMLMKEINGDQILSYMYNHNYLMQIIMKLF